MFRFVLCTLLMLILAGSLFARSNYRGYSGAPGSLGTCASSCHGSGGGTVEITGFPMEYVPDSTYLITITAVSGSSINNFNGSVRVGTGSTNAGTISAGTNTATHNVAGETNGIHLSSNNRTSGTFNWLAPAAGTGTVHLYVGAHQGSSMGGANTAINLTASEAVVEDPPDQATNPTPENFATNVSMSLNSLAWSSAARATLYEIYFGTSEPLVLLGWTPGTTFQIGASIDFGTTFFWRVDARNATGTTTGIVWSFTTEAVNAAHDEPIANEFTLSNAYPNPFNSSVRINLYIPMESQATVSIFDQTGRLVSTLLDNTRVNGSVQLEWNAAGHSAGVYFLRCDCGGVSLARKLVYLP